MEERRKTLLQVIKDIDGMSDISNVSLERFVDDLVSIDVKLNKIYDRIGKILGKGDGDLVNKIAKQQVDLVSNLGLGMEEMKKRLFEQLSKPITPKQETIESKKGVSQTNPMRIDLTASTKPENIQKFIYNKQDEWIDVDYALPPKGVVIFIPYLIEYSEVREIKEHEIKCIYNDETWKTVQPKKWKHVKKL